MPTRDKTRPSGRIHPHERDTDDAVPIIGGGNTITVEHATAIQGTKDKSMKIKSRQSHRNRLKHIYKFWSSDYTNYYEAGTYALTPEQKNDPISEVLKRGTTRDTSRLPPATNFNKSKKKKECDDMLEEKARNPRRKLNKVGKQLKVTQETDEDIDKA